MGRSKRAKKRRHKTRDDDENRAQPGESQKRDKKKSGREGKMKKEEEEERLREGETGRSKTPVYMTKKLPVPGSGEPVLPIIAAPRRPRDSPSSSHATRTSSDRPGPAWLDAPAAAATHRSSVTAAPHTRASPPSSSIPSYALDATWASASRPLARSSWFSLFFWAKRACSARLLLRFSSPSFLERVS